MKNLFVLLLTIQLSQQLTKDQFDALYFKKDYFGKVDKVIYLSGNKICLVNDKGFKLLDVSSQETIYFVTQNIDQVQLFQDNMLIVKSQDEILQFNLQTGKMTKKSKPLQGGFKQFIYANENLFILTEKSILKQDKTGKVQEHQFKQQLNSMIYLKKSGNILVVTYPDGKIISLDDQFNNAKEISSSVQIFKPENLFDSEKFILNKDSLSENLKELLDNVLFSQIEASSSQYKIMKTKKGLEIINASGEELFILSAQDLKEQPRKIFTNDQLLIVQSKLLTLDVYRIQDKQKLYTSEESLAEIKNTVFFLEHDTKEHLAHFMTYQRLLSEKKYMQAWRTRLQVNTVIMKENIYSFFNSAKNIVSNLLSMDIEGLQKIFNKKNSILQTKIAIILTNNGKLHRYNMKTNKIENHLKLYQQDLELKKEDEQVFSLSTTNNDKKEYYDAKLNVLTQQQTSEQNVSKYQFKIDRKQNCINGYFNGKEIWKIDFKENEKIHKYQTMQDTRMPSNSFVIEKDHVLYKLIDPNNFILVTETNQMTNVYIINSKYGKILGQYQVNINISNYQLLVDDNSFFVVYYDNFKHLTEIIHLETFRTKIEKELMPIISKSWQGNNQKLDEIDYNAYQAEYILMQKQYGVDIMVKKIFAFDSTNDLTSKNLLVLTKDDKLYSIPRDILSTRRCLKEEKEKALKNIQRINEKKIRRENYYKSQILPDYEYKIVLSEKDLISGNLDLKNLDKIYVSPSIFESTSDLVVTGQSFLTLQHSPDQLYDQLPNSFDKLKLVAFLAFLVVAYVGLSIWSKNKAKYQNFDTS